MTNDSLIHIFEKLKAQGCPSVEIDSIIAIIQEHTAAPDVVKAPYTPPPEYYAARKEQNKAAIAAMGGLTETHCGTASAAQITGPVQVGDAPNPEPPASDTAHMDVKRMNLGDASTRKDEAGSEEPRIASPANPSEILDNECRKAFEAQYLPCLGYPREVEQDKANPFYIFNKGWQAAKTPKPVVGGLAISDEKFCNVALAHLDGVFKFSARPDYDDLVTQLIHEIHRLEIALADEEAAKLAGIKYD